MFPVAGEESSRSVWNCFQQLKIFQEYKSQNYSCSARQRWYSLSSSDAESPPTCFTLHLNKKTFPYFRFPSTYIAVLPSITLILQLVRQIFFCYKKEEVIFKLA